MRRCVPALLTLACLTVAIDTASARVVYVNNRVGTDRSDGSSQQVIGEFAGPVWSISRALKLAGRGDSIHITNTGVPYYDSLTLVGRRVSGSPLRPFRIIGNGAVLTGAMTLPPSAWQEVRTDVWKVVPHRKGHFQLVRDGEALPELRPAAGETWFRVPKLPDDHWCVFKGAMYFQAQRNADPAEQGFAIARRDCGITIMDAHDVRISGLLIRHFRLDGIQLHDRAESITIDNVVLTGNGRAGLTVRGSSFVDVAQSAVRGNREFSILIEERGGVEVIECEIDVDPTVRD